MLRHQSVPAHGKTALDKPACVPAAHKVHKAKCPVLGHFGPKHVHTAQMGPSPFAWPLVWAMGGWGENFRGEKIHMCGGYTFVTDISFGNKDF